MAEAISLPPTSYIRECLAYEPDNGRLVWRHRPRDHFELDRQFNWWNSRCFGRQAGSIDRDRQYIVVSIDGQRYLAHRIIYKLVEGRDPERDIDHKDTNGLNNIWSNLRIATDAENLANRTKQENNTTGFKGVWFDKARGKFAADIMSNGVRHRLGRFETGEHAYAAYCEAATRLHGEFCKTD